jgi:hypothetical protein
MLTLSVQYENPESIATPDFRDGRLIFLAALGE